jgi:hypothetical protein
VSRAAWRGALTGGPQPQCQEAALAYRRARVARIQTGFKNISNGFKNSPNFD